MQSSRVLKTPIFETNVKTQYDKLERHFTWQKCFHHVTFRSLFDINSERFLFRYDVERIKEDCRRLDSSNFKSCREYKFSSKRDLTNVLRTKVSFPFVKGKEIFENVDSFFPGWKRIRNESITGMLFITNVKRIISLIYIL